MQLKNIVKLNLKVGTIISHKLFVSALCSAPCKDCNDDCSDKNNPRMSTENCNIRGQEDDLSCRADGATRDKLVMLATDLVGLGVVLAVYRIVSS